MERCVDITTMVVLLSVRAQWERCGIDIYIIRWIYNDNILVEKRLAGIKSPEL